MDVIKLYKLAGCLHDFQSHARKIHEIVCVHFERVERTVAEIDIKNTCIATSLSLTLCSSGCKAKKTGEEFATKAERMGDYFQCDTVSCTIRMGCDGGRKNKFRRISHHEANSTVKMEWNRRCKTGQRDGKKMFAPLSAIMEKNSSIART